MKCHIIFLSYINDRSLEKFFVSFAYLRIILVHFDNFNSLGFFSFSVVICSLLVRVVLFTIQNIWSLLLGKNSLALGWQSFNLSFSASNLLSKLHKISFLFHLFNTFKICFVALVKVTTVTPPSFAAWIRSAAITGARITTLTAL